jgi:NTE family protein
MNVQLLRSTNRTIKQRRLPFETVALVLLGGGALGAYQVGVYEVLAEAGIEPDGIAGVSIGAINAALIAGNPPKERVDRLHAFCTQVTSGGCLPWFGDSTFGLVRGDVGRHILNQMSAGLALTSGARGFFKTRPVWPWFQPAGTIEATSFCNTGISSAQ